MLGSFCQWFFWSHPPIAFPRTYKTHFDAILSETSLSENDCRNTANQFLDYFKRVNSRKLFRWSTTGKRTIFAPSIHTSQFFRFKFNIFVHSLSEEEVRNLVFKTYLDFMKNKHEEFYDMTFILKFETKSLFFIKTVSRIQEFFFPHFTILIMKKFAWFRAADIAECFGIIVTNLTYPNSEFVHFQSVSSTAGSWSTTGKLTLWENFHRSHHKRVFIFFFF